jgi:hypothetical protein
MFEIGSRASIRHTHKRFETSEINLAKLSSTIAVSIDAGSRATAVSRSVNATGLLARFSRTDAASAY